MMGKKRKGIRKETKESLPPLDNEDESRQEKWNVEDKDFHKDEIDKYLEVKEILRLKSGPEHGSGSEEEDSESEEVMGLDVPETDEEEEDAYSIEGESNTEKGEETLGPSDKAWGRNKAAFYNTDYIDDEGEATSDESVAEEEQREALSLQRRMLQTLRDDDFGLDTLTPTATSSLEEEKTPVINRDELVNMSDAKKLAFIEEEWPEFLELFNDLKTKENSLGKTLMQLERDSAGKYSPKVMQLVSMLSQLYHLYSMNVVFYLTLRASDTTVEDHPVITNIITLKEMLVYVESLGTIEKLINIEDFNLVAPREDISKSDNDVPPSSSKSQKRKFSEDPLEFYERIKQAKKAKQQKRVSFSNDTPLANTEESVEDNTKRAISYQIAANKGLSAKKKKELRNPRVKHRKKFEKAVTKHRHVIRPVEKELYRYGGEKGGIRSRLARSVKFK